VEIVYTKEFESADTYIEEYIGPIPMDYNVKVATSDWVE
jgi:predicted RNA-binding protein with PIN domain